MCILAPSSFPAATTAGRSKSIYDTHKMCVYAFAYYIFIGVLRKTREAKKKKRKKPQIKLVSMCRHSHGNMKCWRITICGSRRQQVEWWTWTRKMLIAQKKKKNKKVWTDGNAEIFMVTVAHSGHRHQHRHTLTHIYSNVCRVDEYGDDRSRNDTNKNTMWHSKYSSWWTTALEHLCAPIDRYECYH